MQPNVLLNSKEKMKNGQVDPRILNSEAAEAARDAMKAVVRRASERIDQTKSSLLNSNFSH